MSDLPELSKDLTSDWQLQSAARSLALAQAASGLTEEQRKLIVQFLPGSKHQTPRGTPLYDACRAALSANDSLTAENAALRERLICEDCDGDVNAPSDEPMTFGSCAKCRGKLVEDNARLKEQLAAIRTKLAEIVCTEGCDAGVVMLSQDGPTHPETHGGRTIQVCDHEYFSPLGDALMEVWKMTGESK